MSEYTQHINADGELIVHDSNGRQLFRVSYRDGTCQDWGCIKHDHVECIPVISRTCCPGCPDLENLYSLEWH